MKKIFFIILISVIAQVAVAQEQEGDFKKVKNPFTSSNPLLSGAGSSKASQIQIKLKALFQVTDKFRAILEINLNNKKAVFAVSGKQVIDLSNLQNGAKLIVTAFDKQQLVMKCEPLNQVHTITFATPAVVDKKDQKQIHFLDIKDLDFGTVARELALLTGRNIIITPQAAKKNVKIILQNIDMQIALESLCQVSDVWYRENHKSKLLKIMTFDEYRENIRIKPDIETKFFTLLYPNAEVVASQIKALYKGRAIVDFGTESKFGSSSTSSTGSSSSRNYSSSGYGNYNQTSNRVGGVTQTLDKESMTSDMAKKIEKSRQHDFKNKTDKGLKKTFEENFSGGFPIYVSINKPNNMIVLRTGDKEAIKQIEHLIKSLDKPTPQVLLEVKIIEVQLGDGFESVFDFSFSSSNVSSTVPGNGSTMKTIGSLLKSTTFAYQYLDRHIRMRLELMESQSRIHKLSSPLLLCANNEEASIFDGEQRPLVRSYSVQTITNNNQNNQILVPVTELVDVGTTLKITPKINADKSVTMRIEQTVSSFTENGAQLPVLDGFNNLQYVNIDTTTETTVDAIVLAKDGMTVALGGLIQTSESVVEQKVPILGDIDYLGFFFRKNVRSKSRRERILLITPYVLSGPKEADSFTKKKMAKISNSTLYENEHNSGIHFPASQRRRKRAAGLSRFLKPAND